MPRASGKPLSRIGRGVYFASLWANKQVEAPSQIRDRRAIQTVPNWSRRSGPLICGADRCASPPLRVASHSRHAQSVLAGSGSSSCATLMRSLKQIGVAISGANGSVGCWFSESFGPRPQLPSLCARLRDCAPGEFICCVRAPGRSTTCATPCCPVGVFATRIRLPSGRPWPTNSNVGREVSRRDLCSPWPLGSEGTRWMRIEASGRRPQPWPLLRQVFAQGGTTRL